MFEIGPDLVETATLATLRFSGTSARRDLMTDAAVPRSSAIIHMRLKNQGCNAKWPKMDGIFRRNRRNGVTRAAVLVAALTIALSGSALVVADDMGNTESEVATAQSSDVLTWSERYYPISVGNVLYFKAFAKDRPEEKLKIKAEINCIETKDGTDYFYFYAPGVDVRYLVRRDASGVYMRGIKYPFPLFAFSITVDIKPELMFIRFPLEVGAKWEQETEAKARILFIPIKKDLRASFEIVRKEILQTEAGEIEAYLVHAWVGRGDEEPELGKFWYAKGIGYAVANTVEHFAEIVGYRVFDEQKRVWNEKPPENPEDYE
jgi:hypothetical protein